MIRSTAAVICMSLYLVGSTSLCSGWAWQGSTRDTQLSETEEEVNETAVSKFVLRNTFRGSIEILTRKDLILGQDVHESSISMRNSLGNERYTIQVLEPSLTERLARISQSEDNQDGTSSFTNELVDVNGDQKIDVVVVDSQLPSTNWFLVGNRYEVRPLASGLFDLATARGSAWLIDQLFENRTEHFGNYTPVNRCTFLTEWPATKTFNTLNDDGHRTDQRIWLRGEFMPLRELVYVQNEVVQRRIFDFFLPGIENPVCQWTQDSRGVGRFAYSPGTRFDLFDIGADGRYDYAEIAVGDNVEYFLFFEGGEARPLPDWLAERARNNGPEWFQKEIRRFSVNRISRSALKLESRAKAAK